MSKPRVKPERDRVFFVPFAKKKERERCHPINLLPLFADRPYVVLWKCSGTSQHLDSCKDKDICL